MAEICECSLATYYRYRNGTTFPSIENVIKFLSFENRLNANWLLLGKGSMLKNEVEGSASGQIDSTTVFEIPYYEMKSKNKNEEGKLTVKEWENPNKTIPISNYFVKTFLKTNPENLICLSVFCNSMYPVINPGSLVYVNKNSLNIDIDGIFLVGFDNVLRLKIVQRIPGKKLQLSTLNNQYHPVIIKLNSDENVRIMGQVSWIGSKV